MASSAVPFLLFNGDAEVALLRYLSLFTDATLISMTHYQSGEAGTEGKVKLAEIEMCGQRVKATDSPTPTAFGFTPSFSFFVECDSKEELETIFEQLSQEGRVLMPQGDYGFSQWFTWFEDAYGVSWQLNWA